MLYNTQNFRGVCIKTATQEYSKIEEIWHTITHGFGLLLSVSALTLLTVFAAQSGSGLKIASALVFGIALVLMYGASTLYHGTINPSMKFIFQQLDHCAIYVLIAGTYTPICLLGVQGAFGWTLFGISWGIGLIGIILKSGKLKTFKIECVIGITDDDKHGCSLIADHIQFHFVIRHDFS